MHWLNWVWQNKEWLFSGVGVVVVVGLFSLLRVWRRRHPHAAALQVGQGAKDRLQPPQAASAQEASPIRPHPEAPLRAIDEPFFIEPVKRRGPPKANGERDIYMGVRVMSKGASWIRGCRVRLVRVRQYVTTPDAVEKQDIPHIHPAYLRWPPGEGGGVSADFANDATLDVAVIESWADPVYQLLTADESLRSIYQLEFKPTGPILTIEITAESGGRIERSFRLDGDFRLPKAGVEPLVMWVEHP